MQLELSKKEFRRLLDMVYIGNWILNSTRGDDRIADYDQVESKLFALCRENGMPSLVERWNGEDVPSRAFSDGGIHEAIADYEDTVFYEILAEELPIIPVVEMTTYYICRNNVSGVPYIDQTPDVSDNSYAKVVIE